MNWVTLDRDHHPFRYPQAIECPTCGALCATEESAKKHEDWHGEVPRKSIFEGGSVDRSKKLVAGVDYY